MKIHPSVVIGFDATAMAQAGKVLACRAVIDFGLVDEAVDPSTHVVSLRGEIDANAAPKVGSGLFALFEGGVRRVIVDLSEVTMIDSAGIGVILNALRRFQPPRGRLALVISTERVRRPFQITGLSDRLAIFRSREEALGCLATA
jgi:anti-sigma B factor antagonist